MSVENNGKTWVFNSDDVFKDIPDDPNNITMQIPPEVAEKMGWQPGDKLKVLVGDQGTIKIEKVETEE